MTHHLGSALRPKAGAVRREVLRLRGIAGHSVYRFTAFLLPLSTKYGLVVSVRRRRDSEPSELVDLAFRTTRVSDLHWLSHARIRDWLAVAHGWQTRWAAFDWYVIAVTEGRQVSIAEVVDRSGAIGGVPTRIGLLGGVLTLPRFRHHGLASGVYSMRRGS